jgi:hypothetical protein
MNAIKDSIKSGRTVIGTTAGPNVDASILSGRRGGTVTSEGTRSYVIGASVLTRARLQVGQLAKGTLHSDDGDFAIEVIVDTADPSGPFMELFHKTRDEREGDRIVRDHIRLLWTVPTYGGRRWWFQCPRTGRRTTKLYLPNGGSHFWSRKAYGLGYACQREGRFDRLQRRAAMLNRQLGGKGWATWENPPAKPKWMRWRTYERKYAVWRRVVDNARAEFIVCARKILRRPIR